jgi:hypothetical protein
MRFPRRFAAERTLVLIATLLLCNSACAAGSQASHSSASGAPVTTQGARPVIVVHAWKDFLTYWNGLSASQKSASPRSVHDAQKIYLDGDDGTVHRYFSTRGGGQELIALGDWLARRYRRSTPWPAHRPSAGGQDREDAMDQRRAWAAWVHRRTR